MAGQPFDGNDDHLARLDVAHEGRADDVESAGLRRQNPSVVEPTDDERPYAERIAAADHLLARQADEGIGAFDPLQRSDQPVEQAILSDRRDEVQEHLGVGGRLEDRAVALQFALQGLGVGEIAIMSDREAAARELGEERLDIAFERAAGGRVADMANGPIANQLVDDGGRRKAVADEADMALGKELPTIGRNDAGRLLAAVLQRVEAEGGEGGGVAMAEHAKHAAFFVQLVVVKWVE